MKNQVAADSYRGLQANFRLLVGMAYSEALGGWEEINESPKKLQAVTAADIQRVARKYFDVSNRSVATFMRNATAASGADAGQEDPEIAKLPAPMQARAKQMVAQLMFVSCLMFDGVLVKFTLHLQQFQVAKCVGAFY